MSFLKHAFSFHTVKFAALLPFLPQVSPLIRIAAPLVGQADAGNAVADAIDGAVPMLAAGGASAALGGIGLVVALLRLRKAKAP
jgi:hypothetical protein